MERPLKIVVFISGRGSNLLSLLESESLYADSYHIQAILSSDAEAPGLAYADTFQRKALIVPRANYEKKSAFTEALTQAVSDQEPDLIALAGFMQILKKDFLDSAPPVINIHPSLLPLLPGLHTHARAIEEGHLYHGCTVHQVDSGIDTGPIIAQAKVPVLADDTEDMLTTRVLQREHEIYPWVIAQIAANRIQFLNHRPVFSKELQQEAEYRNFLLGSGSGSNN